MIISTAREAAELFRTRFAEPPAAGETVAIAYLDSQRSLLDLLVVPPVAASHADLPLRQIIERALRLGAAGMLVAHNHPSGDAQPSWDDIEATRELAAAAERLGIRLHDHLILAGEDLCSLRGLGLI